MLKIDVGGNIKQKLQGLQQNIDAAMEAGLDHGAQLWQNELSKQIGRTYKRPSKYTYKDDNGRTITREWRRTGDLRRGHRIHKRKGIRELVLEGNAGKPIKGYPGGYAQKLQTLPVSKDGVDRSNDYPNDAKRIVEDLANRSIVHNARNRLRELSR